MPSTTLLKRWKLEDAKARFSELVRQARESGPQRVTVRRKDAVVVVSAEEYDRLVARAEQKTLSSLLADSPLRNLDFGEEGVKSPVREVEL
ncbi:MAG: type II toxin-antitoxin system Phd/YefM family antitoxin [Alphaproteobacteria bacterium GM202ARS2]|nr:type II toxin-antitoxin system Phd/YefM family antitoxin [Alphaproteobacteria bacterium GM202ARS2]